MNILVIRNHRLGDILQLNPMIAGLKERYPGSKITFFTGDDFYDLLSGNQNIDRIVSFPEKEFRSWLKHEPERHTYIFNRLHEIYASMRKEHFNLIINRQYEEGGLLAEIFQADQVFGGRFHPEHGHIFDDAPSKELFHTIRSDRKANRMNLVDWSCRVAGVEPGNHLMDFAIPVVAEWKVDALLKHSKLPGGGPLVAVQMGAAKYFRQWGIENYGRVIDCLIDTHCTVVLVGASDEACWGDAVSERIGAGREKIVNMMGKTSLKELGALLSRCDFLITGDTGPMHMAAAVGTPVLALFYGPAYPWETGPYGTGHFILYSDEPCAPCLKPEDCTHGSACKKSITPEIVIRAHTMMRSMRDDNRGGCIWNQGNVKLLVSRVCEGSGQELIPIEVLSEEEMGLENVTGFNTRSIGTGNRRGESFDTRRVLELYHRGDQTLFLKAVSEFFENSLLLLKRIESRGIGTSRNVADAVQKVKNCVFVIEDLFRDHNVVRIADLIRHELAEPVQSLLQSIECNK